MDALFTDQEMSQCCYAQSKRSVKPPLPAEKVQLLESQWLELLDNIIGQYTT